MQDDRRSAEQSVGDADLAGVIRRNISTLLELRRQLEKEKSGQDKIADAITSFSGSMLFLYLHVGWFVVWMMLNLGWFGIPPFDPFPFGLLTMIVSLEAIFLSTFVLISQNRMADASDEREDLDLQINLLAEYEITKMLRLIDAIADHLGLEVSKDPELQELEKAISPEVVLTAMQGRKDELGLGHAHHGKKC